MKYIKMSFFISIFCLINICISEPAHAEESLFEQANVAYSQNDFDKALVLYQDVMKNRGLSASLFYNIANCYAQKEETGQAILFYERALRLSPKNADIQKNLHHVREEAGLFIAEGTTLHEIKNILTLNQWTLLSLFFLLIITILVICWTKISNKTQATTTTVLLTLLFACCLIMATDHYKTMPDSVIVGKNIPLRISPFELSEQKGHVKEGRLVSIIKKHKDYSYIKDETGRTGWLADKELIPIVQ